MTAQSQSVSNSHKEIISCLQQLFNNEILASTQFLMHASLLKNWGISAVARSLYGEAVEELSHAQRLLDRILFIEGMPLEHIALAPRLGHDLPSVMEQDLALERHQLGALREGIDLCERGRDYGTRHVLTNILLDEEKHYDHLQTQQHLLKQLGAQSFVHLAVTHDGHDNGDA